MKKLLLIAALFLTLPTFAQEWYGLQEYGLRKNTTRVELYGGMVLPENSWKFNDTELGTTGWTAGIGFTRNVVSFFGLGLDANYAQLGDGETMTKGGQEAYFRTGVATGLVTGRFSFFPSQATRLYVPFGMGIGHTFARLKNDDGSHKTYSGTNLATMLGLGLEFDLDESVTFGVEGRYYIIGMADEMKDLTGKSKFHHIDVMLKLGFRF